MCTPPYTPGTPLLSVVEPSQTCRETRSGAMPACTAAARRRATAVALMSLAVTLQVGLALSTGSSDDPQPQPSSRMWVPGAASCGNASSKYLRQCQA